MPMDHMEHFAMGQWLLLLAYLTSVVGCALGLACTLQARTALTSRGRLTWLVLAAVSIGGVGIWVMHFIAMLGFATPGMPVRYDIFRTVLSAVLSVAAVFCGLLVFGVRTRFAWWRLLLGGLVTGLAVNVMHYTGMWAVQIKGTITYDVGLVALSVVIAVIAATVALWFTAALDKFLPRLVAGFVIGCSPAPDRCARTPRHGRGRPTRRGGVLVPVPGLRAGGAGDGGADLRRPAHVVGRRPRQGRGRRETPSHPAFLTEQPPISTLPRGTDSSGGSSS